MTKNLRLYFFLTFIFSGVLIAWNTLTNFFNGMGLNFVALLVIVGLSLYFILSDSYIRSRVLDVFILICVLTVMEFCVYCVFEFGSDSIKVYEAFREFQIFLSVMGILLLLYTSFRFALEEKGVKLGFIETMLGNNKSKKAKKANKELVNGSLEEKPNHRANDEENVVIENTEDEVVVDTEEE